MEFSHIPEQRTPKEPEAGAVPWPHTPTFGGTLALCTLPALWPFSRQGWGFGAGRAGRGADAAGKGRCPRARPHVTPPAAVREGAAGAQPLRRGEFKHAEEGAKLTALFT